ncbi:OmpA family protein [Lysobacter changpingensis]|uniref:OmpA family protein n=1 Tax=Lysobacter changpingensis TaxID=2792784 RepID=UPI001A8EE8C9|nr:OmpA family protein [Lysobacter changpingensis]
MVRSRSILPMMLMAAVAATTACNRDTPASQTPPPVTAAPVAQFDATLNLVNNNGAVRYDGTVGSDEARQSIEAALARAYGRVSGELKVDRGARPAPWQDALPKFLESFIQPGAAVSFEGRRIELHGHATETDRNALLARAELLYPGYAYTGLFQGVGDGAPTDAASAVLAQVKPGTSGASLVKALNEAVTQTPIRFEPGSARVAPDSLALLSKAAQVIQASDEGTRLQIAGPAADDPSLAQQRAEAIKVQLIVNGVSPAALETTAQAGSGEAASFQLL